MKESKTSAMIERAVTKYFDKYSKYPSAVQVGRKDFKNLEINQHHRLSNGIKVELNKLLEEGNTYLMD